MRVLRKWAEKHAISCDSAEQDAVTLTSGSNTHLDLDYAFRHGHTHTHTLAADANIHVLINICAGGVGRHRRGSACCSHAICHQEAVMKV